MTSRGPGAPLRVRYGRGCALTAAGIVAAVTLTSGPAPQMRTPALPADDPEAVRLLRVAAEAERTIAYEGRRFLTTWGGSTSATGGVLVAHTPGAGTVYGSGGAGIAGEDREVALRAGVYRPDPPEPPAAATLGLLGRNYTLRVASGAKVLGRSVRVVEAHRLHGGVAGRFWVDDATGLLLRRELLDATGRPVAASGFAELRVGRPTPPDSDGSGSPAEAGAGTVLVPASTETAWPVRLNAADRAALRSEGWPLPETLPGRLRLYDARRAPDGTVHLGFSDGLAAVSVFVQPGRLDRGRFTGWKPAGSGGRPVYCRDALRRWAVTAGGGYVFTVLTEAPESTATSVARTLPPGGDGVVDRMRRGARRLGSWVNPFD